MPTLFCQNTERERSVHHNHSLSTKKCVYLSKEEQKKKNTILMQIKSQTMAKKLEIEIIERQTLHVVCVGVGVCERGKKGKLHTVKDLKFH